jgi:acyl-coenzyme A synthetase/AMP-(fatty) acid ligase
MGVSFVESLGRFGDAPALLFQDGIEVSYRALAEKVTAQCVAMTAGNGGKLLHLLEAEPRLEAIVSYLASLQAGHAVILTSPGADHAALIADYRPDLISARIGGAWRTHRNAEAASSTDLHPDLTVLLSTSGSTGSRKLVRLSAVNIDSNATSIAAFLGLTQDDRGLLSLPLHYSYGLSILHSHLAVGASVFVTGSSVIEPGFLDRAAARCCTNMAGVPYSYELFERIRLRDHDLPALRFMTVAGGRLDPDLVRRYARWMKKRGGQFFVMYGQTEATARIAYLPPAAALDQADCIGDAIPGGTLLLRDEQGHEITAVDVVGELIYRGPNVMMGYATCRADLCRGPEITELATGDLASRNSAGLFRITGRANRFSKIAGLRIGHDEVERQLAARGYTATITGTDLHLIAVMQHEQPGILQALIDCTGLNAAHFTVLRVDALPRTAAGKIDYPSLAALASQSPTAQDMSSTLPIHDLFASAFYPQKLRATDSFFSLGGDSLTYVQLSLSLEQCIGRLPADWEHHSIAALSALAKPDKRQAPQVKPARQMTTIDTNVFLRAIAILLIVMHHATLWPMPGGAASLFVLVGYSLARFQRDKLFTGQAGAILKPVLRNLSFYYVILLVYCLAVGTFPWQSLLLLGNWGIAGYSTLGTPLITYWFVEAYGQLMLLLAAAFAVPAIRRGVAASPFAAGLGILAGGVILRLAIPYLWDAGEMRPYTTAMIVYLAAFGWCVHFADSRSRKLVLTCVIIILGPLFPGWAGTLAAAPWIRAAILTLAAIALIWWPRIPMPAHPAAWLARIAAASYFIYLLHNVPFYLWILDLDLPWSLRAPLHFSLGIGLGLAAYYAMPFLRRHSRQLLAFLPFLPPRRVPQDANPRISAAE